jgi:hypothetical protein
VKPVVSNVSDVPLDTVTFVSVMCSFVCLISCVYFTRRGGDDAISIGDVIVALSLGIFNFGLPCTSENDSTADI